MTEHKTHVERSPHGNKFWWVCSCGAKQKRKVSYVGYAERDGEQHAKDKEGK